MDIRPYQQQDRTEAMKLEIRLRAHDTSLSFPIIDRADEVDFEQPSQIQLIVAADDAGIHGGYYMRCDHYRIAGIPHQLFYFGYPISEGVVNKRYAALGLQLQIDIEKRAQLAYGLGGGGMDSQVNQLKQRGGWSARNIPCLLYINQPEKVLRELPSLHRNGMRSLAAKTLACSRAGKLSLTAAKLMRSFGNSRRNHKEAYEIVETMPHWIDEFYERCAKSYNLLSRRDRKALDVRFPNSSSLLSRGIVREGGKNLGWFVTLEQIHNKEHFFGNLKVGLLADFLAHPKDAMAITRAATDHLLRAGCDMIVCNACHASWIQALRKCGYFRGPTNFPFLASPKLTGILSPLEDTLENSHIVRADGDSIDAMLPLQRSQPTLSMAQDVNWQQPQQLKVA